MLKKIAIVFILIFFGIGACSAANVEVSPTSIDPGDTINIEFSDLQNGSSFSLLIKGNFDVTPNGNYVLNINSFNMPISLSSGTISASADNSKQLSLNYNSGNTIKTVTTIGNDQNVCTISESQSVSNGIYEKMWIDGYSASGDVVNTELSFIGTKSGVDSGTISFALSGIDQATINIICRVEGTTLVNTPIYVGGGSENTATATATATATSSASSSGSSSSSGGGGGSGGSSGVSSGSSIIDKSTYTESTTPTATESAESVDGSVRYTGDGASGAVIMYDSTGSIPDGWNIKGQAYALISDGSTISGKIWFAIPSGSNTDNLFIAEYVDGQWLKLSSVVYGDWIYAPVSGEGTFALMSSTEPVTVSTTSTTATATQSSGTPAIICVLMVCIAVGIGLRLKK